MTVEVGLEQQGREVFAAAPPSGDCAANSIAYIAMSIVPCDTSDSVVGVLAARVHLREPVDERQVVVGQAHELTDHARRQRGRDVVHELDVALLAGRRHDLAADRADLVVPCSAITRALNRGAIGRR